MNGLQKRKLDSVIHFLAVEHKNVSGQTLYKTSLFKYIDLFEFEILHETGIPPLNLEYRALEKGPVPIDLNSQLSGGTYESEKVRIEIEEGSRSEKIKFIPLDTEYDLDLLSDHEIDKIYSLVDRYATNYKNNQKLIEATHEILAWKKAWRDRRDPASPSERMNLLDEMEALSDPVAREQFLAAML